MSGSAHRGTRLADMPHTPWGISAFAYSSAQGDTSSAHPSCLPSVSGSCGHEKRTGEERKLTGSDRLLQVLNSPLLAVEMLALGVVQPTKLLQNLGVVGVAVEDPVVGSLRILKLSAGEGLASQQPARTVQYTYVFLLLMDMADLEPYVLLGQRCRRRVDDVLEALRKSGSAFSSRRTALCDVPRGTRCTSAAACRLYPVGSKSHGPCRNQAASS